MRERICFKLVAAFVLVIGVAVIFDLLLHTWKGPLLAVLVALIISAIAAQATARRLDRIVPFETRGAAGALAARIEATYGYEIGPGAPPRTQTGPPPDES